MFQMNQISSPTRIAATLLLMALSPLLMYSRAISQGDPQSQKNQSSINLYDVDLKTNRAIVGRGVNTVTTQILGQAVEFGGDSDLVQAAPGDGQLVDYQLEQVESLEKLKELMQISATASLGLGIFGAKGSVDILRTSDVTKYENFLFVDVLVRNPVEMLRRYSMTEEALRQIQANPSEFVRHYGNAFIYGRETGGHLTALVQFSSTDQYDYENVKAELSASLGIFFKTTASFVKALERMKSLKTRKITLLRHGGIGRLPDPLSIDDIIDATRRLPEAVQLRGGHPVVINMLCKSYDGVPNMPRLELAELNNQALALSKLASYLDNARLLRGDLLYMHDNPEQFEFGGNLPDSAGKAIAEIDEIIDTIQGIVRRVLGGDKVAVTRPSFPVVKATRKRPPVLTIYLDENHNGRSVDTDTDLHDLNFAPYHFHDKMTSFTLRGRPKEYRVIFYEHAEYGGNVLDSAESPMSRNVVESANDKIDSIRIIRQQ